MNKIITMAAKAYNAMHPAMDIKVLYSLGFHEAFKLIDENLALELNKLEEFQAHGERLMTLKIYKARIAGLLKEMEQEYE